MSGEHQVYAGTVDISNCDKEPIHIIGHMQSHGVLVACDASNFTITQAGENCKDFFGKDVGQLLGQSLSELLDVTGRILFRRK